MKIYQIQRKDINSFMFRQALGTMRDMGISVFILLLLLVIIGGDVSIPFITHIGPGVPLFFGVFFLFSFFQQNIHLAKRFIIDANTIYQIQDAQATNLANDIILSRLERKSGQQRNQTIPVYNIKSISITKNKATIKSVDFNIWNANGRIQIPREVNDYEEVVAQLKQIANSRNDIELKVKY